MLQWFLAVIMPFFAVFGRVLFTGELGWLGVIGLLFSPIGAILLLVPPLVALFDREARRLGSVRVAYAWATVAIWVALFAFSLTAPDSSDAHPYPSPLQVLTGIGSGTSMAVTTVVVTVAAAGWLLALGVAIAGIVRSRRSDARAHAGTPVPTP
ncbi:hypothetical protein GCM10022202_36830 [Microbacterium marinilacus]|uniref:Uncharacterized protein n=1 Tax=Microbacterium marinilacus TaxID=415209 RepID=A0ABP7BZZ1_9MICO